MGIDVNTKNVEGDNAIHQLCRNSPKLQNLLDLVRVLVDAGIDVNARTLKGFTAVFLLWEKNKVFGKYLDVTPLLLNG